MRRLRGPRSSSKPERHTRATSRCPRTRGRAGSTSSPRRSPRCPRGSGPAQASLMPKLVSPNNNPVLAAGGGAQFYRLAGIELTTLGGQGGVDQYSLVAFAAGNDIVVDRSYLHGSWNQYVRQGVQLNNARTA